MTLKGKCIAVVEDDAVLATDITFALEDAGASMVGPAKTLKRGLAMLSERPIDGAILDVELPDGASFPLADLLRARDVPFVFYTSYASSGHARAHAEGAPVIGKDNAPGEAVERLAALIGGGTRGA